MTDQGSLFELGDAGADELVTVTADGARVAAPSLWQQDGRPSSAELEAEHRAAELLEDARRRMAEHSRAELELYAGNGRADSRPWRTVVEVSRVDRAETGLPSHWLCLLDCSHTTREPAEPPAPGILEPVRPVAGQRLRCGRCVKEARFRLSELEEAEALEAEQAARAERIAAAPAPEVSRPATFEELERDDPEELAWMLEAGYLAPAPSAEELEARKVAELERNLEQAETRAAEAATGKGRALARRAARAARSELKTIAEEAERRGRTERAEALSLWVQQRNAGNPIAEAARAELEQYRRPGGILGPPRTRAEIETELEAAQVDCDLDRAEQLEAELEELEQ